ncbi:MAG: phosphoribosylanthranilate isomerase [Ruminiclostridium sp.]|nr:phosphoribosylanthranilate isomerase [Ruminiclostridium sp.]
MTRLKICGLMNEQDIQLCAAAGANMLGFVINYPVPVPWALSKEQAKELLACVPEAVESCIVTGGNAEEILSLAVELRPDYVQLHYKESFEQTEYLAEALLSHGIKTIKAVPVRKDGSCEMPGFSSVAEAVSALSGTMVAAVLIDTRCAASPASSSRQLDAEFCRGIIQIAKKPLILSGGITADNLGQLLKHAAPYGVDILTGTEDAPGQKNSEKIEKICRTITIGDRSLGSI